MGCAPSQKSVLAQEDKQKSHDPLRTTKFAEGLVKLNMAGSLMVSQGTDYPSQSQRLEAQTMANQAIQIFRELNCHKEEIEAMLTLASIYQHEPLKQNEVLELAEQTCRSGLGENHQLMDKIRGMQASGNS